MPPACCWPRWAWPPEDLLGTSVPKPQASTFADYIPEVAKAASLGTRRVYGTYWNRFLERWGHRHLDEPTTLENTSSTNAAYTHASGPEPDVR